VGERLRPPDDPRESDAGVSMISSWVGVPAASSLTGVPSTQSPPRGLESPSPRLNPGLPCRKLLILDSRLGAGVDGADRWGGGVGGDNSLTFSQSLVLPGVSRLRLLPREGLLLGVVGVTGVLDAEVSGEVRLEEVVVEEFVTLCSSEENPGSRKILLGGGDKWENE